MSPLHPAITEGHPEVTWHIESDCQEDWLLRRWEQTVSTVFWAGSLQLFGPCGYAVTSTLHKSRVVLPVWLHRPGLCITVWLYEQKATRKNKVHTYATMRSDSSETSVFFSWTSWIHCSIISGEPPLPASGKTQWLERCVQWWVKKKKRKYGNDRHSVVEQDLHVSVTQQPCDWMCFIKDIKH